MDHQFNRNSEARRAQRMCTRKRLRVRMVVRGAEIGGELWFNSDDLSAGGVFLVSDFLFEKDSRLEMSFELPGMDATIQVVGRVVWVNTWMEENARQKPPGMGVMFESLNDEQKQALECYLESVEGGK